FLMVHLQFIYTLFPYTSLFRSRNGYILHIFDGLNEYYVAKEVGQLIVGYKRIVASAVIRHDIANNTLRLIRSRVAGVLRGNRDRSEEHTSELQSREKLVCRLLL